MATDEEVQKAYDEFILEKVDECEYLVQNVDEWWIDPENPDIVTIFVADCTDYEQYYKYKEEDEFFSCYDNDINAKLTDGCYIWYEMDMVYLAIPKKLAEKLNKCIVDVV